MGENGDRARGLAERALVVLEGEAVEPVADVRRQIGVAAADLGDAVGVLDDPDRLAAGVAVDDRLMARDPAGLRREAGFRLRPVVGVEPVPASARNQHEQDERERRDDRNAFEPAQRRARRPRRRRRLDVLFALGAFGQPDVSPVDLDQDRLEPLLAAELLDVALLREPSALRRRGSPITKAADEKVQLERGEGEEGHPGRDPVAQAGHEEPRQDQRDRRDPQPALEREAGVVHPASLPPPGLTAPNGR